MCCTAWSVPRNSRPNPFLARGRSLLLLGTAGLAVVGTTALSTLGSGNAGSMGTALRVVSLIGSIGVNALVFVFAFRLATARHLSIPQVLPGALTAAVLWQLLQTFGVGYVGHVVSNASATNGVFALVLGLLAFLYLASVIGVLCVEINVVRVDKLHPRALLTPFTDAVHLTPGDKRSYTGQAKAQRSKGFEQVHVTFDAPQDRQDDGPDVDLDDHGTAGSRDGAPAADGRADAGAGDADHESAAHGATARGSTTHESSAPPR
jgi:membrane protein